MEILDVCFKGTLSRHALAQELENRVDPKQSSVEIYYIGVIDSKNLK